MDTEHFSKIQYEMGRAVVSCGIDLYIWTDYIYGEKITGKNQSEYRE